MNKWILGARPRTLPAAIAPVVVASALAGADFNLFRAALALKVAVWLQIGVNFANDYSDGVKGTDADRVGPIRLVASGIASAKSVKAAAFISFAIASVAGTWLAFLTSPLLILVGVLSIAAAWGYTGGKKSLWLQRLGRDFGFSLLRCHCNYGFLLRTNRATNALEFYCLCTNGSTFLCDSCNQQSSGQTKRCTSWQVNPCCPYR